MQAILLATGENEKLRPLTDVIPAALLPVANQPVMGRAIELLARQHIKHIVVSLWQHPGSIEAQFGDGRRWGVKLEYVLQRDAWGSAGALRWAQHALHETFIVLQADVVLELDLASAVAQHRTRESAATAITHAAAHGAAGAYIFEPHVLAYIPARTPWDIDADLLPTLRGDGLRVDTFEANGRFNRLATFEAYAAAQVLALCPVDGSDRHDAGVNGRRVADGIWVGKNNVIHPSVRLAPPVCIGDNCRIGRDVELGPNVVLGDDVIIDDLASLRDSVILDKTYVGQLVNITERVVSRDLVIDTANGQSTRVSDHFLLCEVQTAVFRRSLGYALSGLVALLLLVALAPLLAGMALLAWLQTGRIMVGATAVNPQPHSGDGPRPFPLLAFATRRADGSHPALLAHAERLMLHRLPALWNVVRQDLLLVGVCPLPAAAAAGLPEAWQQKHNEYPAGLTGLWYTQAGTRHDRDAVLISDAYYVATRSWREDLRILWQTPRAWWLRSGQPRPTEAHSLEVV